MRCSAPSPPCGRCGSEETPQRCGVFSCLCGKMGRLPDPRSPLPSFLPQGAGSPVCAKRVPGGDSEIFSPSGVIASPRRPLRRDTLRTPKHPRLRLGWEAPTGTPGEDARYPCPCRKRITLAHARVNEVCDSRSPQCRALPSITPKLTKRVVIACVLTK